MLTMNSRTLTRSSDDRYIGGVAGGLGRYFDIDPTLVRVGFVFATLVTGGAAIVGYVALLAFVPSDARDGDPLPA
jgi:phage shock protein C